MCISFILVQRYLYFWQVNNINMTKLEVKLAAHIYLDCISALQSTPIFI